MRKYRILFLLALAFAGLVSCQSDEDGTENEQPEIANGQEEGENGLSGVNLDTTGWLLDGGRISSVSLYCIKKNEIMGNVHWQDYYASTKTLKDYSEMQLDIKVNNDAQGYFPADTAVSNAISRLEVKYYKERTAFIVDEMLKYISSSIPGKMAGWPDFLTAYINGEVVITCDKVLYGEEPGTNLSGHFRVLSDTQCLPVGVENPSLLYNYGDQMPTILSEYLPTGAWLKPDYWLEFDNAPAEKYDNITLHLTFPLLLEHSRDYAVELYRGNNSDMKYTEHVFNADCSINFNWE